ncbi:MAG: polynucleotide adenylyltransferase PcnB [Burkholderiales bacterium]|nr:polynucleotide adenylyltransferase PcnB [Burkholderiales bacterium]
MMKKFIDRLFGRRDPVTHKDARPVVHGKDKHTIQKELISRCARRTCEDLQRAGYLAFVVGGAVRDLLLGRRPKDFDIATSATPEDVRSIFRRSRIIGRRFQIVHVMSGAETVEVSTFRAHFTREANEDNTDEHGRMLSDNVFGTQAEDAMRRDFTVNALFYDPVKEEVWDYVHGLKDLKSKKLVMIGDPATRYREDPVRMLRAARLAAKLGLEIDAKTRAPIHAMRHLLENVPQARLFEEILKLLLSGNAVECVRVLRELELHHGLLPLLDTALEDPEAGPFAMAALRATDERLAADKPVSPAFLLAALLWGQVEKNLRKFEAKGQPSIPALHAATHEALDAQRETLAIPRRFDATMKELWLMQPRFLQRGGQRPYRLLEHPRFRAAYDFFALRAASANAPQEAARWWERFQDASADEREEMLVGDEAGPKKKRRRRRGKRKPEAGAPPPPEEGPE